MRHSPKLNAWLRALTNPHLILCVGAAWFCTNGWAYCAAGIGYSLHIGWLLRVAMVYLGILWMPGTPEKLFTFGIAMLFLKWWFPDDERTLAAIRRKRQKLLAKCREWWERIRCLCKRLFRRKSSETE